MTTPQSIETLRTQWTEAERKLYPLATVNPQKYQQLVLLAREVANNLATTESHDDLAQRWADAEQLVSEASTSANVPVGDLPVTEVAGVGFSLRDGELRMVAHQREQRERIAAANDAGQSWALLHEQGNLDHGLMDPYSSIHLHLATGAAIVASVEPNPVDAQANYVLTVIRMDPATGEPIDIDPGIADTQEHPAAAEFLAGRDQLQAQLGLGSR